MKNFLLKIYTKIWSAIKRQSGLYLAATQANAGKPGEQKSDSPDSFVSNMIRWK